MSNRSTSLTLIRVFTEVTQSLKGLLDLHDCDPQLIEDVACTLRKVFWAHYREHGGPGSQAVRALYDLLEEERREPRSSSRS
jgi:hypothetical protein